MRHRTCVIYALVIIKKERRERSDGDGTDIFLRQSNRLTAPEPVEITTHLGSKKVPSVDHRYIRKDPGCLLEGLIRRNHGPITKQNDSKTVFPSYGSPVPRGS